MPGEMNPQKATAALIVTSDQCGGVCKEHKYIDRQFTRLLAEDG